MEADEAEPAPRLDNQDPTLFGQTPSQTVGPFFHYGLPWRGGADLVGRFDWGGRPDLFPKDHDVLNRPPTKAWPKGEVIEVFGRVYDGERAAVPDTMIEIWQANAAGRYASPADERAQAPLDPGFIGFGRSATSAEGDYRFRTIRPGRVPGPGNSLQAPHLAVSVFGRGLLKRLSTRLYFADAEGNEDDPVLAVVPAHRRRTLIASPAGEGQWRLDIVLQGPEETVFFDL
jgi:protocatechuate 3,4-dioxygenase alpha subunit